MWGFHFFILTASHTVLGETLAIQGKREARVSYSKRERHRGRSQETVILSEEGMRRHYENLLGIGFLIAVHFFCTSHRILHSVAFCYLTSEAFTSPYRLKALYFHAHVIKDILAVRSPQTEAGPALLRLDMEKPGPIMPLDLTSALCRLG